MALAYFEQKKFSNAFSCPEISPNLNLECGTPSPACFYCQTPDLGQGLEFDFTFANNKNNENNENNPHLNFPGWDGTRGLKFGTQT